MLTFDSSLDSYRFTHTERGLGATLVTRVPEQEFHNIARFRPVTNHSALPVLYKSRIRAVKMTALLYTVGNILRLSPITPYFTTYQVRGTKYTLLTKAPKNNTAAAEGTYMCTVLIAALAGLYS